MHAFSSIFEDIVNHGVYSLGMMPHSLTTRDNNIPLRIFNIYNEGDLVKVALGDDIGTLVVKE
jgi:uridylate kinase